MPRRRTPRPRPTGRDRARAAGRLAASIAATLVLLSGSAIGAEHGFQWRLLYGIGTDTPLNRIIRGEIQRDTERNAIAGLQLSWPLRPTQRASWSDLHASAALIRHIDGGDLPEANELAIALKRYYHRFPWRQQLPTRLGLGVGLSYADRIPAGERQSLEKKGNTSKLLLHLDLGIDVDLGRLSHRPGLQGCFLGIASWHRSGVFGRTRLFNHVDGGYNWVSLSLACRASP